MIRIHGTLTMKSDYLIDLDLTEEEFDSLSQGQQNVFIVNHINMTDILEQSVIDDLEIWDVYQPEKDEQS